MENTNHGIQGWRAESGAYPWLLSLTPSASFNPLRGSLMRLDYVESMTRSLPLAVLTASTLKTFLRKAPLPESLIFQDRFRINRDLDRVADDDAAAVQGVVPTDAKVLSVD